VHLTTARQQATDSVMLLYRPTINEAEIVLIVNAAVAMDELRCVRCRRDD